jgi:hypothetical protein
VNDIETRHTSPHDTSPSPTPELQPKQTLAVEQLVAGGTVTQAAEAAGVDRTTVHRWLRNDFAFQAAYNNAQRDLRREVEDRLTRLTNAAAETVVAAVEGGDVRAALAVLRGLGLLPGRQPTIGADDPEELAERAAIAERKKEDDRIFRRIILR